MFVSIFFQKLVYGAKLFALSVFALSDWKFNLVVQQKVPHNRDLTQLG